MMKLALVRESWDLQRDVVQRSWRKKQGYTKEVDRHRTNLHRHPLDVRASKDEVGLYAKEGTIEAVESVMQELVVVDFHLR